MKNDDLFNLTNSIINNVVNNHVPFRLAIRAELSLNKKINNADNNTALSRILGNLFNHYYLFLKIAKKEIGEYDDLLLMPALILLTNEICLKDKKIPTDEIIELALKQLKENGVEVEKEQLEELIKKYDSIDSMIEYPADSFEYHSEKYDVPLWLIKMWNKYFGDKIAKSISSSLRRQVPPFVRIDKNKISEEEFLKDEEYKKTIQDGIYIKQNLSIGKSQLLRDRKVYEFNPALNLVFDDLQIKDNDHIALYFGSDFRNMEIRLNELTNASNEIDFMVEPIKLHTTIEENLAILNIRNIKLYEAKPEEIITCVSSKVDHFFVSPLSSNFDSVRYSNDFFIHYDRNGLDELIEHQKYILEEAISNLNDGGDVIYFVPTISNKEGHFLINEALRNHPELVLVKERQIFPFTPYRKCFYFAILRKEVKE